jgi:prephenate dehydratase
MGARGMTRDTEGGWHVAYQGAPGAFSSHAIDTIWGTRATGLPLRDFDAVLRAVIDGHADYGVLPVENSAIGSIHEAWFALHEHSYGRDDLVVLGCVSVPVRQCLLAPHGATLATVCRVSSHPAALAQCRRFFARHPALEQVDAFDTAGAAADVAARGDVTEAAIAPLDAARRYGLTVLAENVQDDPSNTTRFVVLAMTGPAQHAWRGADARR